MAALVNSTGWVRQLWWRALLPVVMKTYIPSSRYDFAFLYVNDTHENKPRAKKSPALRKIKRSNQKMNWITVTIIFSQSDVASWNRLHEDKAQALF